MNNAANAAGLAGLPGTLEAEGALGKAILYFQNPADNGVIGSIMSGYNGMLTDSRTLVLMKY